MKPIARHDQGVRSGRRTAGRAQLDAFADPYQAHAKPREPTVCRQCGVLYHRGRWQWGRKPDGAHEDLCPACRRANDDLPAGTVTIRGAFAQQRQADIIALARHQEQAEKAEHPLNRIIAIEEVGDGLVITTTDIHLPRRLGTALKRAYDGELELNFDSTAYSVRVDWHRAA